MRTTTDIPHYEPISKRPVGRPRIYDWQALIANGELFMPGDNSHKAASTIRTAARYQGIKVSLVRTLDPIGIHIKYVSH